MERRLALFRLVINQLFLYNEFFINNLVVMSFNINPRESWSRSEFYDNKFRHYPEESRLKEARRLEAMQDIIEPQTSRIEKQMTEKFLKGVFHQEGASIRYIQAVGKFVFVAVYEPTVKVAEMVQKLVIQYALPFAGSLLDKLKTSAQAIGDWVSQLASLIAEKFSRLFQFKLKRAEKAEKNRDGQPFAFLKKRLEFILSSLKKSSKKALSWVVEPLSRHAQRHAKSLKEWLEHFKEKIQGLTLFKIGPFSLPTFKFKVRFKKLTAALQALRKITLQQASRLKELRHLKAIPLAIGSFLYSILLQNYESWIKPLLKWVLPPVLWIYKALKKGAKTLQNYLKAWLASLSKLVFLAQKISIAGVRAQKKLMQWAASLQAILIRAGAACQKAGIQLTSLSSQMLEALFNFAKLLKRVLTALGAFLVTLPKATLKYTFALFQKLAVALFALYVFVKVLFRLVLTEIKQDRP